MTNLFDFIKSAAEYSKETVDIVTLAHGIVNDINANQQKCAELAPNTVNKLASLERANGQPFLPDGFEKKALECLSSHEHTIALLNNVLTEYGKLKEAFDNQTPTIGKLGPTNKTAATKNSIAFDGAESRALQNFTERMLNL